MSLMKRAEVATNDTWDLSKLYHSTKDWENDFQRLENQLNDLNEVKGRLAESPATLYKAVDKSFSLSQRIEKIYCYAHLLADQDTSNATNQGLMQKALNLYSRISLAGSFIRPELLKISDSTLSKYLSDPLLKPYARAIKEIVRYKEHTLDEEKENILALATEVLSSPGTIFSQLNNADLKFGTITDNGEEKTLTHGSYQVFLRSPDRSLRKNVYAQYMSTYDAHKNTIAATYTASIKRDIFSARARGYGSALKMSLFPDQVPESVYDNLISTVTRMLPALHNYYHLRNKLLNLESSESYDLSTPLVKNISLKFPYEEACSLIVDSLTLLGEEYTSVLRRGLLEERWVDRYENEGKRSGAYQSSCYNNPPFILMNYKEDTIDTVYTLAHEAGHAMHTYFSSKHQTYQDHDYPIFSAEVASTFNEQLLSHYLLNNKLEDPQTKAYIINHQIDEILGTLFRQTLFAEFEKSVHEIAECNESLTVDVYRSIFGTLLDKYNGPAVKKTPLSDLNGLRIPHFYSAFYVYKYATGLSAAISLSEKVISEKTCEGTSARDKYLTFLKSGGSKPPIDTLKDAGVDLNSPRPIEAAIEKFESLTRELEKNLSALNCA